MLRQVWIKKKNIANQIFCVEGQVVIKGGQESVNDCMKTGTGISASNPTLE